MRGKPAELPLEQLKGLHLPGKVVALLKSMLADRSEPQAAIGARFTSCCPQLLRPVQS